MPSSSPVIRNEIAPPSAGVAEGQRSRSRAMATGSADTVIAPLVPQQFVDAGLGSRAFVHALDDDGAIEPGAAALAGQRPGYHNGIRWDFALRDRAGLAVDDARGSAEIDAHRQHRARADDHAFRSFRARLDEAIVCDDDRARSQRLELIADAG